MVPGWCHRIPPATTAKPSRRAVAQWLASALGQKLPHSQSQRHFCFDFTKRHKVSARFRERMDLGRLFATTQWRSKSVSPKSLPKREYLGVWPETFDNFSLRLWQFGVWKRQKTLFCRLSRDYGAIYLRLTGLVGWRRSADCTCLRANSLLTGNFSGNFAISGLQDALLKPEAAVPQRLLTRPSNTILPRAVTSANISLSATEHENEYR